MNIDINKISVWGLGWDNIPSGTLNFLSRHAGNGSIGDVVTFVKLGKLYDHSVTRKYANEVIARLKEIGALEEDWEYEKPLDTDELIKDVKKFGQSVIDDAEKIVGEVVPLAELDICLHFSNDCVPEITWTKRYLIPNEEDCDE